jgi:hypothetical protein
MGPGPPLCPRPPKGGHDSAQMRVVSAVVGCPYPAGLTGLRRTAHGVLHYRATDQLLCLTFYLPTYQPAGWSIVRLRADVFGATVFRGPSRSGAAAA